jgi:hypothetical protein
MRPPYWLVMTAMLLCSCATPFIEQAHDPPGISGSFGVGRNTDLEIQNVMTDNPPYAAWNLNASGSARWRNSERSSMSISAGFTDAVLPGNAQLESEYWVDGRPVADLRFGYKHDVGRQGALKGEIGLALSTGADRRFWMSPAPTLTLAYLRDFGRHFTGRATVGTDGIGFDLNVHAPLSGGMSGFIALGVRNLPDLSLPVVTLGLGIEAGQTRIQ